LTKEAAVVLLDAVVGLGFVASAVVLIRTPAAMRWWWAAVGVAWWIGDVEPLRLLHQGVLLGALAAYPTGRARSTGQLVLLGVGGVVATGLLGQAGSAAGLLAVAAFAGRGVLFARLSAILVGTWLAGSFAWSQTWPASYDPAGALTGYELALLVVAVGLPFGIRWDARRRASLADRVLADGPGGLVGLEAALRRTPGLRAVRLTRVDDHVVVEGLGAADAQTSAAVDRAVSLTIAHEDELAAAALQLRDLQAARTRVLVAADAERSRAALRLQDQLTILRRCQAAVSDLPPVAREVEAAATDIERVVTGLAPEGLGDGGIGPALASLCARHPVRVDLEVDPDARGTRATETALFYTCSEALANVAKHAGAESVAVRLRAGDPLELTVSDDGVGGADPHGSGLQNLADRLATVGGSLTVDAGAATGTLVVARVPGRRRRG
jgi:signal transduction histidine kinase